MFEDIKNWFLALIKKVDYAQVGLFVLIVVIGFILRKIAMKSATLFFKMIDKKTKTQLFKKYLKPILKPVGNFVLLVVIHIGIKIVAIPDTPYPIKTYLIKILSILIILNIAWFLTALVNIAILYLENFTSKTESKLDDQLVPIIRKFLRAIIFIIAGLVIFQNLGYSVSGILAGIGVGGFALAFASKDALANIFGSIIIFTDRPFQVGDWVKTSNAEGTIEEVGLRSTKIRTFDKTVITIPNSSVSNSVIENLSKRPIRRIKFKLGVTYAIDANKMEEVLIELKKILANDAGVDQSYYLVNFTDFGESALEIFIYYFTKSIVWEEHLETKQRVNLNIMRKLAELNVDIAFPSRTIYMEKG